MQAGVSCKQFGLLSPQSRSAWGFKFSEVALSHVFWAAELCIKTWYGGLSSCAKVCCAKSFECSLHDQGHIWCSNSLSFCNPFIFWTLRHLIAGMLVLLFLQQSLISSVLLEFGKCGVGSRQLHATVGSRAAGPQGHDRPLQCGQKEHLDQSDWV